LYERLLKLVRAKSGGLVSIAHRPALEEFHDKRWQLVPTEGPAAYRLQTG
jgi:putative ATP-binding cassette transporter